MQKQIKPERKYTSAKVADLRADFCIYISDWYQEYLYLLQFSVGMPWKQRTNQGNQRSCNSNFK